MDLKIALGLLLAMMCVPGGWSYVRDREVEAEEEVHESDDDGFKPRQHASLPPQFPFQGFPGLDHTQEARIVGGTELPKNKFPFMVLMNKKEGTLRKQKCGGTILDELHVVTAAHCVTNLTAADLEVVAGEHDNRVTEGKEQTRDVQKIFLHPSFNKALLNDVAVLKLATALKFNTAVTSFGLNSNSTCPTRNQYCYTAGWGRTSHPNGPYSPVPLYIQVPVDEADTCDENFDKFGEDQLCIGGMAKEACCGDSGGPMVCDCGGWKLVGITSYGEPCGIFGYPSAYTKVSYFYRWIKEQTRK